MKIFIGSVIFVTLFLIYLLLLCRKNKSELSKSIQAIIAVGTSISIVIILQTLCTDERISLALFGAYFCLTDWLMFAIARFALKYTNYEKYMKHINYAFPALVFDVFFMALNVWYQYAFSVKRIQTFVGEFYKFVPGPFFQVHGVIVYFLVITSLLTFLIKTIKSPGIYKKKYYVFFILFSLLVILEGVFMFMGDTVDFTVYGYAVAAALMYYFALSFIPKELMNQTISIVSKESKEGIIIFDEVGCIFCNNSAKAMLRLEDSEGDSLVGMSRGDLIRKYIYPEYQEEICYREFKTNYEEDGKTYYYKSVYRGVYDEKGKTIGTSLIMYDKTREDEELRKQRYLATHDTLTGLYNKDYFLRVAADRIQKDLTTKYVLICTDITKFSLINDLFGEDIADGVIIRIAEEFREKLPEGALYGRLYADRFAMLFPRKYLEEKMLVNIAEAINVGDREYAYTVKMCFGVYEVANRTMPVSIMCDRAQAALSTIKEDYRKYVAYYNEASLESVKKEQEMISELDEALKNRDMTLFLQPIVKTDGKVVGAEALARWIHPKRGLIPPGEFIPVFEKRNLIVKMDYYIWEMACELLAQWEKEGRDWFISVNISTKDIYFLDIFDVFTTLVAKYKIASDKIRLEITESAIAQDVATVTELITRLQRLGFIVEIDDFGSGYSGLNMLKDFPADVLKIDMKFLSRADEDKRSKEILRSVISLAKNLGMDVITEGVETIEQAKFLSEERCDMFQGYYFSKPIPVDEFIKKTDEIPRVE
ncbi:MAG: EAL domain-containing protein [Lachnospiraceae bacterium]|nr:EAL domain-containing protein [Lachnospiraceae bacterium]